ADREFKKALASNGESSSEIHLEKATRYNPYQPYYNFTFVKRIVDSNPHLDVTKWVRLLQIINDSIMLNPVEAEFYVTKARIFRALLQQTGHFSFYTETVSSYQAALGYDPFNVFLRTEFAYFLFRSGRLVLAEDELNKVIALEPAFLNA